MATTVTIYRLCVDGDMGCVFLSLTRSDQLWSFPSRSSIVSGTKVVHFLIVLEQPVSIENRSGSIVRKPSVGGRDE